MDRFARRVSPDIVSGHLLSPGIATTATALAANLGVDEGDIDVLLGLLDERSPELSDELAAFLRQVLDPHGERTAPLGSTGRARTHGRDGRTVWGGPDPTA